MADVALLEPVAPSPSDQLIQTRQSVLSKVVNALAVPTLATFFALVIGGIVMGIALGQGWTAPFEAYWQLFTGAFGGAYDIQETLTNSIPLMFAAFAIAFSFRGGLFNIGAEGQLYAGAIASAFLGYTLNWPGWLLLPVCILVSIGAGAIWALIPALLKAYRGAHEVITTMMMNYIALNLLHFLLINSITGAQAPMEGSAPGNPVSKLMNVRFPIIVPSPTAETPQWLAIFFVKFADLNLAFPLALLCGGVFWFILTRTTLGYNIRATGFNINAARYAGINVKRTIVMTLLISGAFAGLAGSSFVFGIGGQLEDTFDSFTFGFDAIAVALLGRNTATGAVLAAILFGALEQGGRNMQANAPFVDPHIIAIIQGLIIFFVGADQLVRYLGGPGFVTAKLFGRLLSRTSEPKAPTGTASA